MLACCNSLFSLNGAGDVEGTALASCGLVMGAGAFDFPALSMRRCMIVWKETFSGRTLSTGHR